MGVARSAYEYVLKWAKTYTAGGSVPIIHHQAVGYLLAEVAMKIEACRAFSWKAAHYLDLHDSEGHAVGAMAKVFCGETLFNAVFRAMQAMGVNALDKAHPVEKFLREAAVFPLYDAGNIGMQMRKIWGVMLDDGVRSEGDRRFQADRVQEIHGGTWYPYRRRGRRACGPHRDVVVVSGSGPVARARRGGNTKVSTIPSSNKGSARRPLSRPCRLAKLR